MRGCARSGRLTESLATFPTEFVEGMTKRALKLGDFGSSAPANWPAPFDKPARVHIVASIYADEAQHLDRVQAQVARAFTVIGIRDGRSLADSKVFFGYIDSISQPRFEGMSRSRSDQRRRAQRSARNHSAGPPHPTGRA